MARKSRGRKRARGFGGVIRSLYRVLSIANTANVICSGDVSKIVKHAARKKTVRAGGKLVSS